MSAAEHLAAVRQAKTTKEEVRSLELLEDCLLSPADCVLSEDALEEDYLQRVSAGRVHRPETCFPQQAVLNQMVCYVFVRRFGWSEAGEGCNPGHLFTEPQQKIRINESLANILHWFHEEQPNEMMLISLIHTIKYANQKPVVRSQTAVHLMEWLKQGTTCFHSDIFDTAKESILLALTDVWSPIRSACVSRLSYVIEKFDMYQLEIFFSQLISIIKMKTSSWQAREGAIMGINTLIRKFQWIGILPDGLLGGAVVEEPEDTAKCEFTLKFGSSEFPAVPEFISKPFGDVIAVLLADPQLSIREHAIKGYSAYLGRCELKVAVQTFGELVAKLNPAHADMKNEAAFLKSFVFLGDYEAEGLLGVCVHLVKQIPSQHLLPMWPYYFPVFSMYLGHTACTVRQITSTIFKFVVAKDSSNPVVLKLVLHSLCCHWIPDTAYLSHDHLVAAPSGSYAGVNSRITLKKWLAGRRAADTLTESWEWREGRLLAYELILQFLIKNHWLYTFGSANLGPPSSPRGQEHSATASDKSPQALDRSASPLTNRMFHHSMKAEPGRKHDPGRRGSCSPPRDDLYGTRDRTSSESLSNRVVSETVDVPHNHHHHCHRLHQRIGTITQASNSLGSTQDGKYSGRMPTVYGCGVTSVKSYGRHYSYYSKGQATEKSASGNQPHSASSLLALCLASEHDITPSGSSESWMSIVDDTALSDVLRQILIQCIESSADARWELRRMGQQLLPCVVEVMRWYNITLMEDFLDKNLLATSSLLTYGGCVCLMHSLSHAARLQWLLQEPPSSWQDVRLCQRLIQSIIRCIKRRLPDWLSIVNSLLQRPIIDRLTVVAMETIMIAIGNFGISQNEKYAMTKVLMQRLVQVYSHSHRHDDLLTSLTGHTHTDLSITTEGLFGCKSDSTVRNVPLQLEKYILNELRPVLRQFVLGAPVKEVAILLPLTTAWVGFYIEDDQLGRHLMDGISLLCTQVALYLDNNEGDEVITIKAHCLEAMNQLTKTILIKTLDEQSLRQLLELGLAFLKVLPVEDVTNELLLTTAARLTQITDSKPNGSLSRHDSVDRDLYLNSNDVLVLSAPHLENPPSDEDDQLDLAGNMPETQMLNISGNSGHSVTSRHHNHADSEDQSEASESEEDSSDWDDWDDDEKEDHSGLEATLKEFVATLKCRLVKMNRGSVIEDKLRDFPERERRILKDLLT